MDSFLQGDDLIQEDPFKKTEKFVGYYFSASWCPPCVRFTPILNAFYHFVNRNGKQLEIVWASKDRDYSSMMQYYKQMPWLAIPYNDPRIDQLRQQYKVKTIPKLVILSKEGKMISESGTEDILKFGLECIDKWSQSL